MKRTLDDFQEVGWLADNGKYIRTNAIAELSLSVIRTYEKDEEGRERPAGYKAHMIFSSARTQETLAIYEREFTSTEEILELLGIEEDEEVWEVLE